MKGYLKENFNFGSSCLMVFSQFEWIWR